MLKIAAVSTLAVLAVLGGAGGWWMHQNGIADPAVLACEAKLISELKSPASYRRVRADIGGSVVSIKYDAQNGYGALLRGTKTCRFRADGTLFYFDDDTYWTWKRCEREGSPYTESSPCRHAIETYVDLRIEISETVSYPLAANKTALR